MVTKPKKIPSLPGVYIFRDAGGTPLYIGKSSDLKKRVYSYFRATASKKARELVAEASSLDWKELSSEIEALIEESELIKKHQTKYNVLMRDDKNYPYVAITDDKLPKIIIAHQPFQTNLSGKANFVRIKNKIIRVKKLIGPFTDSTALRQTLRLLRNTFPFCSCAKPHERPCINSQIRRCPGYCCIKKNFSLSDKEDQEKIYQSNISKIDSVLSGHSRKLIFTLKKEMKKSSREERYELAEKLRDQMFDLENILAHRLLLNKKERSYSGEAVWNRIRRNIKLVFESKKDILKTEGYDISHLSGSSTVGSMVVFIKDRSNKSLYRKFRIKKVKGINDVASLTEVILRRLSHKEWPYPDIMVIDGGLPQLGAAESARRQFLLLNPNSGADKIFISALAKSQEELYFNNGRKIIKLDSLPSETMHFFQHIRNESHRFAKKYHHQRREINLRHYASKEI